MIELNIEKAIGRLHEIISDYIKDLRVEIGSKEQKLKVLEAAKKAKVEQDLESLINIKDLIQNDALSEKLRVAGYFKQNQATGTSQYKTAHKSILESAFVQDSDREERVMLDEKQELSSTILRCEDVIENGVYDGKFIMDILKQKNISKEEILEIFSALALITCAPKVKENTKEHQLTEHGLEELEQLKGLIRDYEAVVFDAKNLIDEFYYLTEKKTSSQIKVYEYVVDLLRESKRSFEESGEEVFDISDMQNPKEALTVLIFNMIGTNKSIENIIATDQVSPDDVMMLELFYLDLKEHYELALPLISRVKEIKKEEEPSSSNVIYIHDEKGQIPFSLSDFPGDGKSRVRLLIEGLKKGVCDSEKGLMHSKLHHSADFTVFINKKQPMACSYIRINDDLVMVLDITSLKNIYTNTAAIVRKQEKYIEELIKNGVGEAALSKHYETAEAFESQVFDNSKGGTSL